MPEQLNVERRNIQGKRNSRRLRASGRIPAVLYGHGQENVSLSVAEDELKGVIRHGSRLVNLTGAASESAFIRELQWNTWGTEVLHLDLTRISLDEKVEIEVVVEIRGEAPGVKAGGVVEQLVHQIKMECPAGSIPEKLTVSINHLNLDETILASALTLPEGATLLSDPEMVVVQCVVPTEAPEEAAAEAAPGEPEVIGAKKEEEEEE